MSCFHPREIVVNKRKFTYQWTEDSATGKLLRSKRPLGVLDKYVIQVPCGKCPACLALQQSQWSFRIEQEALYGGHSSCLFITYTYDNEHLPSDFGLHKEEMQKYLHDLRQNIDRYYSEDERPKVRYYICGEYGSKRGRPHFHGILFFSRPINWLLIQKSWNKGIVDIRPFSSARAGYVAKYSVKQLELDYEGRPKPFHMQSQGLGKCFLDSHSIKSLRFTGYFTNASGRKVKLPRYYLDKLMPERYITRVDRLGNVHREINPSGTFSFSRQYFQAYGEFRFYERARIERTMLNLSEVAYNQLKSEESIKLEHELKKLNLKSSYYVKTAYELRYCPTAV